MKYEIIGWCDYDDPQYEESVLSSATDSIIGDEMKKNGYFFMGIHHTHHKGCTPVLNNGKKCCYSERYFAKVVAVMCNELYEHAEFVFMDESKNGKYTFPSTSVDKTKIVTKDDLIDTYEIELSEEQHSDLEDLNTLYLSYDDKYRFMDTDDIVRMKYKDMVIEKTVKYAEIKYHYLTKIDTAVAFHIHFKGPFD